MRTLTDKQERFAMEYLVDLNGSQAAIRAGYCKRNAGIISNENLSNPRITKFIAAHKRYFVQRNDLSRAKAELNLNLTESVILENISKMIAQNSDEDDFDTIIRKQYVSACLLKALRH